MALKGNSADQLVQTKKELDAFLGAKDKLETVRRLAKEHAADLTPEQKKTLAVFERTFLSYIIEDPEVCYVAIRSNKNARLVRFVYTLVLFSGGEYT